MNAAAANLNWLVGRFVQQVAAVRQAVVVSSDGLPLAGSEGVDRETGERLAAVASGMIGLAYGSAGRFGCRRRLERDRRDGERLDVRDRDS